MNCDQAEVDGDHGGHCVRAPAAKPSLGVLRFSRLMPPACVTQGLLCPSCSAEGREAGVTQGAR